MPLAMLSGKRFWCFLAWQVMQVTKFVYNDLKENHSILSLNPLKVEIERECSGSCTFICTFHGNNYSNCNVRQYAIIQEIETAISAPSF